MTTSNENIVRLIEDYDKQSRAIKEEALRFCWYMRGGLAYDEAILLSGQEREIISKLIKDNMETTKDSGLPFF